MAFLKSLSNLFPSFSSMSTNGTTTSDDKATLPTAKSTSSFWHSEPSSFLLGHRTTSTLPSKADIVIVGSGITGTSAARFLAEDERANGKKIVMLEAREACWGATGRNGGHCQPLLFDRGPDVARFELRNVAAVREYVQKHKVPCEWRDVSGCRTFWSSELMADAEKEVQVLMDSAPDIGKMVEVIRDQEELKKHRVDATCAGATISQGAASLWPYKLVAFILEKLIKDGRLDLQTTTPVTKISSSYDGYALETPRGTITATTVILATNAYTSAILPSFTSLIVPCRGEMSALLPPKNSSLLPNSYGMVGALEQPSTNDDYLIQRPFSGVPNPAGHLMFGGGRGTGKDPSMGVSDDSVIDEGSAKYLRGALLKVLDLGGESEGLKELTPSGQWTGIMGYSRDNHPWAGEVPDQPGLFISAGYTGHGMPNGTLCGKAVVQMVLGKEEKGALDQVQKEMVEQGDIPKSYLLTRERLERAKTLKSVRAADADGSLGNLRF